MLLRLAGNKIVQADRAEVWASLHNVDRLALCIPGCVSLVRMSPTLFAISVRVAAGPVSVLLDGTVGVVASRPLHCLWLRAQCQGAVAGRFAGTTRITLHTSPTGCRLSYELEAQPSGLFATIGAHLLAGIARDLIDASLSTFAALIGKAPMASLRVIPVPRVNARSS